MPAFHYIALNQEQKELAGVIEAPDEAAARKKLNELTLSVVSLNTLNQVPQSSALRFEFQAIDKNGKKVVGTIAAEDPVKAYARLFGEYQLTITALVDAEKEQNIAELHKAYERLYGTKKKTDQAGEGAGSFEKERQELLSKVDFTMQRMEEFLKTNYADLKIDERDTLRGYLNQLMRIKDSTNLEHIKTTCERMLDHIQKQELFINEGQKLRESSKLKIETKALLDQLKQTGLQQDIDLVKTAHRLQENRLLRPFVTFLLTTFTEQNSEIIKLKQDIKVLNSNIRSYLKVFVFGKTKALRIEALESIKMLRAEKKRLQLKIDAVRMEVAQAEAASLPQSLFWERISAVLGWVLAFYILSYVLSYPFTIKQFGIAAKLPKNFYFYHTGFMKGLTIFLFLFYGAIAIRNYWLPHHRIASYLLMPLTCATFLLIIINLM